jgi:hypothetical protein
MQRAVLAAVLGLCLCLVTVKYLHALYTPEDASVLMWYAA